MGSDLCSRATSDTPPVVFVVDQDSCTCESLARLIRSAGWQPEIFPCAAAFLERPPVAGPACVILENALPDLSGLDVQQRLATRRAELPIVMASSQGDVPTAVRAMRAGALDFVTKPVDDGALLATIADAIERSRSALKDQAELRVLQERHGTLTPRERQVMERVVAGRLNKLIAADLDISEITVKAHRGKMMQKMKARSLPDLVRMAARLQPRN